MMDRESIFEKIEAKEKEWKAQVKDLKLKTAYFDCATRIKIEKLADLLNTKLSEIEKRTKQIKKLSNDVQCDLGDKIIYSWVELFTEIDNAMLKLKKKLG